MMDPHSRQDRVSTYVANCNRNYGTNMMMVRKAAPSGGIVRPTQRRQTRAKKCTQTYRRE